MQLLYVHFAQAWMGFSRKRKDIITLKKLKKKSLNMSEVIMDFERFQFRHIKCDPAHIADLKEFYTRGYDIAPIKVWKDPNDGNYYVLDGHHRYSAQKSMGRVKIKTEVFEGSEAEALLICLEENTHARLSMTKTERADAAWRLVCQQSESGTWAYSQADTAKVSGISRRQVAIMRRTYTDLRQANPDDEHGDTVPKSWKAAMMTHKGLCRDNDQEWDAEAWVENQARELDDQIGQTLGLALSRCPDAAIQVIARHLNDQTAADLVDYLGFDSSLPLNDDDFF